MNATARPMPECHGCHADPSADADEFLLVRVVVAKDESPRADDGGVTHGAASTRPQLDLLREIADDRAKFALLGFPRRCRGQPQHQHLCAGRPHALDNFARRKIGAEIRDTQAAAGGEHGGAQRADLVALAGQGRKEQAGRRLWARVQPEERAEDVPHGRGHQVFMRDAGRPPMPVVAHLRQHRHQHVPEQFERRQDRREPADLLVDGRGIVFLQRGGERGGVDRCPSRGIDLGHRARAGCGEMAQFRIGEPCEAADAVSVFHRAAQQAQPRDVGVGVHPAAVVADGRDGAMAALPRAQRVDRHAGQFGDRADRVVRGRVAWFLHRPTIRTAAAHAADAAAPHATSASVSTNGHWRSVE